MKVIKVVKICFWKTYHWEKSEIFKMCSFPTVPKYLKIG